jgi:hypothetical protein
MGEAWNKLWNDKLRHLAVIKRLVKDESGKHTGTKHGPKIVGHMSPTKANAASKKHWMSSHERVQRMRAQDMGITWVEYCDRFLAPEQNLLEKFINES